MPVNLPEIVGALGAAARRPFNLNKHKKTIIQKERLVAERLNPVTVKLKSVSFTLLLYMRMVAELTFR